MKQTLAERVQKSKGLELRKVPGIIKGRIYGMYGSKGDHYQVHLLSGSDVITTPDGNKLAIGVIRCGCQKYFGVGWTENCKGNSYCKTICYHCLAATREAFAEDGKQVAFAETYEEAVIRRQLGGKIAKVESLDGEGKLWAVVQDKPRIKTTNLDNEAVELMRLSEEEEEGID